MKTKIVFLCSVLALVMSNGAAAQSTSGFYGGLGIGQARAKLNGGDFTLATAGIQESRDETNTAYKFFGGYQLIRFIGAELSYTDFGKFSYIYDAASLGGGVAKVNYKANSLAASAVASVPLGGSGFSRSGTRPRTRSFCSYDGA